VSSTPLSLLRDQNQQGLNKFGTDSYELSSSVRAGISEERAISREHLHTCVQTEHLSTALALRKVSGSMLCVWLGVYSEDVL